GRPASSAARLSDLVLDTGVRHEADRPNLAPTTSTTAMLALSDALAVAVMEERGFGREAFARYHPAGTLGKRLLLRVRDVMRTEDDLALVGPDADLLGVMAAIARAHAGAACVIDPDQRLLGFITEGDLRRHLLATKDVHAPVTAFLNAHPVAIEPDLLAFEALEEFQNSPVAIGEAPVLEDGRVVGVLMLKDLLRSGIV
ncbi:MAG: KpsF/GutQ family sugar-phosphate isomerase, partial [Armatimonadota bacterium]